MFSLTGFNALLGQDSYVRCKGKERIDPAIIDAEEAAEHLESGGTIGWWVKTGYIVVDIDEGQEQALKIIKKLKLKTLIAKTPKGLHLYFKTSQEHPQKIGMTLPCGLKCDFRCANKGYVLLPYGTTDRSFNTQRQIAEMPPEFTPIPHRKESLLGLREGDGRNNTLFAHLMAYKNRGASPEQIEEMANIINDYVFAEPMTDSELQKVLNSTKKYEAQQHGDNPYLLYSVKGVPNGVNYRTISDYFVNAENIFALGGECYQYRHGVYREASSYVRNTIKEMIAVDYLIAQSRIVEAYRLIIDDTRIQKTSGELNQNRNLINFKNGVWDIEAQRLLPHSGKYLQTLQIPHNVLEGLPLKQTRIYKFLNDVCGISKDNIDMILRYAAYCLTLDYGLKTFMILCGQSNTGKSVFIRWLEALVGICNTSALSMHELNMRFYPSQLHGKLLNSCADNSSLPLKSIESLKKLTGGDQIMHEKKGKEPFFFVSFAKLIFSFNQLPLQLEEKSNAFYKRMRILSMSQELSLNNEYVEDLCSNESIEEIIPYLLSLLPLQEVPSTPSSRKLVEALRQDSDTIHSFIMNRCRVAPAAWVKKQDFYDAYAQYCLEGGREAHKKHTFMRHIRSLGYKEARHPDSREACWKGIGLRK